jgi:hypothetical protein
MDTKERPSYGLRDLRNGWPIALVATPPAPTRESNWLPLWLGFILVVLIGVWLAVRNARKRD